MSTPDTYGRRNPAADIVDLHDKPPAFLMRQDRDRARLEGVAAVAKAIHEKESGWPHDQGLADYIDNPTPEAAVPANTTTHALTPIAAILQELPHAPLLDMLAFVEGFMKQPDYNGADALSVAKSMCTYARGSAEKAA